MSLDLIDAKELNAWYVIGTKQLCLYALGEVQPITVDIQFKEDVCFGGIMYSLLDRCYAVMGDKTEYKKHASFTRARPNVGEVYIITEAHPKGITVPIHVVGTELPLNEGIPTTTLAKQEPKAPQKSLLDDEYIYTIDGETFKIQYPAEIGDQYGSIHAGYDNNFVQLEDAGIQAKNIFWVFKAQRMTNNTQITLTISGGIKPIEYQKVYNVSIGSLGIPPMSPPIWIPEPFLARVQSGFREVRKQYPEAKIHRVTAKPPFPQACTNPGQLDYLRLECDVGGGKLAITSSKFNNGWTPCIIVPKLFDDVASFTLEDIKMDPFTADELMKDAGFKESYTAMKLEKTIYPDFVSQLYYIFEMTELPGGPSLVYVGVDDKRVIPYGQALPPNPEKPDQQNGKF